MSTIFNNYIGYLQILYIVQLDIKDGDFMDQKSFSLRLSKLRINKGVSARDMSLSIGQSPSYINNIETGLSYPSMTVFFYICDYLGITPAEFFDTQSENPTKEKDLLNAIKGLSNEQLDNIITLVNGLKK